jgi:hypothetical protein
MELSTFSSGHFSALMRRRFCTMIEDGPNAQFFKVHDSPTICPAIRSLPSREAIYATAWPWIEHSLGVGLGF